MYCDLLITQHVVCPLFIFHMTLPALSHGAVTTLRESKIISNVTVQVENIPGLSSPRPLSKKTKDLFVQG